MPRYYPIFLNVSQKKCVVVGGGRVALRKVKTLLDCGAKVAVISPEVCPELNQLAEDGRVQLIRRAYLRSDLHGALVAIAATDNCQTNTLVSEEAQEKGILVNVVDDAALSNFIAPSYIKRGDITIAISTAGRSPALARKLRCKLEKDIGVEYGVLVNLIDEVRTEIKRQTIKIDSEAWQEALDLDLLIGLIKNGEIQQARESLFNSLNRQKIL